MTQDKLRLAIISDYPEEKWHSMDLCAQMLLKHLQGEHALIQARQICPKFRWRFQQIPWLGKQRFAYNSDRILNRFWDYPRYLGQHVTEFDFFHIADHSYAQLVHVLPPERTGVYCHDIDAFRSLVQPEQQARPSWYQGMSRRILLGLQKAAIVFYSTTEVRKQIEHYQLVESSRLVHAPLGIAPEFFPSQDLGIADQKIQEQIGDAPFLLHVGSCIPRKRIDILLEVFAGIRAIYPQLRLVKVSGEWTVNQQEQIERLNLSQSIIHLQGLERSTIASLYRQASVVLLTSEVEGFGFPVIEALASGAIVVASDIPVLREVGGQAVVYCPLTDISAWVNQVGQILSNPRISPNIDSRLAQANKYSWSVHAQTIAQSYLNLAAR
ncbi:MAG: glycosyltransferase [Nostocaceae cyanobacterium]|nr:glycosyltransferase [Nostocaceae cyanobacterium]